MLNLLFKNKLGKSKSNRSISLALGTPFIKLFLFVGLIINFFGIGLIVSLIFKFVRNGLKGSPFLFLISNIYIVILFIKGIFLFYLNKLIFILI